MNIPGFLSVTQASDSRRQSSPPPVTPPLCPFCRGSTRPCDEDSALLGEAHKPKAKAFLCVWSLAVLSREKAKIFLKLKKKGKRSSDRYPTRRSFQAHPGKQDVEVLTRLASLTNRPTGSGWRRGTAPSLSKVTLPCLETASLAGPALGLVGLVISLVM